MKIGIVFKSGSKRSVGLAKEVVDFIKRRGHEVLIEGDFNGADYILTFGGDGTLIHEAGEWVHLGIPIIGVNTGNLGFLTAAEEGDWRKVVGAVEDGKIFVSERMTLDVRAAGDFRAVNEVTVKSSFRVVDLKINVNGEEFLKISGDGVIVSTQTGSTAYSLSAGGPIVDPGLDALLVTPANSIGLPIPSIVLSPQDVIEVEVTKGADIWLVIDGQEGKKLKEGDSVKITKGKYRVKLGYLDRRHFLNSLYNKFGLAGRTKG